jgi:hypothetical protein
MRQAPFRRNAERRSKGLVDAASVRVFHDPADPAQAIIERSAPILRTHGVLLTILVIVLLGLLAFPFWWASYASQTAMRSKHQYAARMPIA